MAPFVTTLQAISGKLRKNIFAPGNPHVKIGVLNSLFILFYFCCSFSSSAQVTANFTATPRSGCAPIVVQFTDISTGGPTAWSWNFGNGNTSTAQNPATVYSTVGTYTVTLTVSKGASSDAEVKTNYIIVYNPPQAGFSMTTDTACAGQSITFSDATTISPGGAAISNWSWDFGDGNTQTTGSNSISHSYSAPGTYPVSLTATDNNGCGGNKIKNVVILAKPVAAFSGSPLFACTPPLNVTFSNTSASVGATSYSWSFGDGNSSAIKNPSHNYTTSGSYNVKLVVNQNGCKDSITKPAYVIIRNETANFSATPTVACTGTSIAFSNSSFPFAVNSNWNFGDAGTSTTNSPNHTYTSPGTYSVTLIATDATGCKDTVTNTIVVDQLPTVDFTAPVTASCSLPFTVNFANTSTGGSSWLWNFGDGSTSTAQTPSHTYSTTGNFNVSLTAVNVSGACSSTVVKNNFISISLPVVTFTALPDSGCVPLNVGFTSTSVSAIEPVTTWYWDYGDGNLDSTSGANPNNIYVSSGIYTPVLIIKTASGCRDTFVCNNCVRAGTPPAAKLGIAPDTVCYGVPVNFSDSSSNATGWKWIYGDGGTDLLQNPTHVYSDTGTYWAKLVAYNNGCADTTDSLPVVILPPKAVLGFTLSCSDYYSVQFTSTSKGADSLLWKFGDGSIDSSNIINPSHVYSNRGGFTTTLVAFNYSTGCSDSANVSFTIAEPIAGFTVDTFQGCYPFTVNFDTACQDAKTFYWNFNDPAVVTDTSVIANPSYIYNNPGLYLPTLIITDINGCMDTVADTLKSLGPVPYFTTDTLTGCRPLPVTFTDTSATDSVLIRWIWNYGDGTIDTTSNDSALHIYSVPGNYNVTMTVTDTNGCVKSITKASYIQPTFPYPSFSVDTFACKGDVLTFDASASAAVNPVYIWDYGDGQQDTTNNPVIMHAYQGDSLYTVTLKITDGNGCDSTIIKTVRILKPVANFNWNIVNTSCGSMNVHFTDSSSGFVTNWLWNFGDGATSVTADSSDHNYLSGGIFDVTMIVTNAGGCKDTVKIDSLIVVPFPLGDFSFTPVSGCNPLTVDFAANGINSQYYIWDFGDGTVIQNGDSISHTYVGNGTYNPVCILGNTLPDGSPCLLSATNLTGSVNVVNLVNVSIAGSYVVTIPQDSVMNVVANINGGSSPYNGTWSPSSNISCATCPSTYITGTGDTVVYLYTVYDNSGCMGSDSILVISPLCVEKDLIPNIFSPNNDGKNDLFFVPGVCKDDAFSLTIYDRWGILVYTSTSRTGGWDGKTDHGTEFACGTYYYIINVGDNVFKGFLQLVR